MGDANPAQAQLFQSMHILGTQESGPVTINNHGGPMSVHHH